jgi:hypothetical protein
VHEEDAVVEVESDHPHLDHQLMNKTLSFKGAESIEISFTSDTRTAEGGGGGGGDGEGGAFVCFYKDESMGAKYGLDKYEARAQKRTARAAMRERRGETRRRASAEASSASHFAQLRPTSPNQLR